MWYWIRTGLLKQRATTLHSKTGQQNYVNTSYTHGLIAHSLTEYLQGQFDNTCIHLLICPHRQHIDIEKHTQHCCTYMYIVVRDVCVLDSATVSLQVTMVCQRMLKEREDQVRVEYTKILETKLAGRL